MHVLIAAREAEARRVLYSSSAEVYGRAGTAPVTEMSPTRAVTPAGLAKLADEDNCLAFAQKYGLEIVRLRYFNVFGPRQPAASPFAAMTQQIVKAMVLGRNPIVHGDGLDPRDLIYVDDVVHANLLASETPRVAGKAYNIASGLPTTPLEIVDAVNGLLGTHLEPILAAPRPRCELQNLAEITRAEAELGFCRSTDLEQGLRRFISFLAPWRDELRSVSRLTASVEAGAE